MPIRLTEIYIPLDHEEGEVRAVAAGALSVTEDDIASVQILRRAIDARRKPNIRFVYTLLVTLVECAVAAGDLERARGACAEIDETARSLGADALLAAAACAAGWLALAEGDTGRAASSFRTGWRGWTDVGAPYEAARARLGLARALVHDDEVGAAMERDAAVAVFEGLGAIVDVRSAADVLGSADVAQHGQAH